MGNLNGVDLVSLEPARDKEVMKKTRYVWTIMILITAGILLALVLVGCSAGSSQATQAPPKAATSPADAPSPDGSTLLETRCSACHSVDRATQAKKTLEQWDQTVTRMIAKGAKLTEAEKTVLVEYLAENYGP